MSQLESKISEWLKFIEKKSLTSVETDQSFEKPSPFAGLLRDSNNGNLAPFRPYFSQNYLSNAEKARGNSTNPITAQDGLQTIINMCRSKSEYDPLDQKGKGTQQYFLKFTNLIAGVPFLSLDWADVTTVEQKSTNADELIESFLKVFKDVQDADIPGIRKSLHELVKAALSYSRTEQQESQFSQHIFSDDEDKVKSALYSSIFTISQTNRKGVVTFHSKYSLSQASYSLSYSTWDRIKDSFADKEKESVDDWLNSMTTPVDSSSGVKALCLEDSK